MNNTLTGPPYPTKILGSDTTIESVEKVLQKQEKGILLLAKIQE